MTITRHNITLNLIRPICNFTVFHFFPAGKECFYSFGYKTNKLLVYPETGESYKTSNTYFDYATLALFVSE
jgi:hypothetical protein